MDWRYRERERARIHAEERERHAARQRREKAATEWVAILLLLPLLGTWWLIKRMFRGIWDSSKQLREVNGDIALLRRGIARLPSDAELSAHDERRRLLAESVAALGRRKLELEGEMMSVEARLRDAAFSSDHPALIRRRTSLIGELEDVDTKRHEYEEQVDDELPGSDATPTELHSALEAAKRHRAFAGLRLFAWSLLPAVFVAAFLHAYSNTTDSAEYVATSAAEESSGGAEARPVESAPSGGEDDQAQPGPSLFLPVVGLSSLAWGQQRHQVPIRIDARQVEGCLSTLLQLAQAETGSSAVAQGTLHFAFHQPSGLFEVVLRTDSPLEDVSAAVVQRLGPSQDTERALLWSVADERLTVARARNRTVVRLWHAPRQEAYRDAARACETQ